MIVKKLIFSTLAIGGLILLTLFSSGDKSVLIQSLESTTNDGGPVYNKIKFERIGSKDVWMMNQSHFGVNADSTKWDRLAIIIDREKREKTAQFLQLPPGELVWQDDLLRQKIEFKVSCFMCHSNGPRLIRPNDRIQKLSFSSKINIFLWNLRIKSYGLVIEEQKQVNEDATLMVPFRHRSQIDNEELKVTTCLECHNGQKSWFARAKLTRQNSLSIKFMLENKFMPPLGFSLSEEENKEIKKFINGF